MLISYHLFAVPGTLAPGCQVSKTEPQALGLKGPVPLQLKDRLCNPWGTVLFSARALDVWHMVIMLSEIQ